MKTVTIRLEDPLHKKLKIKLANEENTFQQYILELINENLKKAK
ncbi:MAG: hypothetical protein ACRC57_12785 [Sarcina sp.]